MRWRLALAFGLAALGAGAAAPTVPREGIAYRLSVAGVPIGSATLAVQIDGRRYTVEGTADFGFLFWGGRGGARSEGVSDGTRLVPARYRLAYEGVRRPGGVEIDFDGDRPVRWDFFPPIPPEFADGRIEVTEAQLRGVLDPLTAMVIPARADAPPEQVCRRLLPVFSGVIRFDVELTGIRESAGVATCSVRYRPVAGHRPDSASVERLTRPDAFELALAPISPHAWGPARLALATRFGTFEMVRVP